ncbi:MAG: hypothetical protein U5K84_09015 [Alkalibacterium sp.]|nr:hypothetical protein [Alkalibacterium sp.]
MKALITERIEEQEAVIEEFGTERPRTAETAHRIIEYSNNQLEALRQESSEDYFFATRLVHNEIRWARYGEEVDPQFYDIDEPHPRLEQQFWIGYIYSRYEAYGEEDFEDITPEVVEERTALQTIQRLMIGDLPLLMLILLVLFSIDSLTKNKGHATLFNGTPLTFGKNIMDQNISHFAGLLTHVIRRLYEFYW